MQIVESFNVAPGSGAYFHCDPPRYPRDPASTTLFMISTAFPRRPTHAQLLGIIHVAYSK